MKDLKSQFMTPRLHKYLTDAHSATSAISQFVKGRTQDDFFNDLFFRSAVERQFEILGEALNLASKEKEDLELEIPDLWKIIGLRNRIIHGYDTVDDELVWDISQRKIPLLHQRLEELL